MKKNQFIPFWNILLKSILLYCILLSTIGSTVIFAANSEWHYDKSKSRIYTTYKMVDDFEQNVTLLLEINKRSKNKYNIIISALIPANKYNKDYAYIDLNGVKLVKNDIYFLGKKNDAVPIRIGDQKFNNFIKINNFQLRYKGKRGNIIINKMKKSKLFRIDDYPRNNNGKKEFSKFSLSGFTQAILILDIKGSITKEKTYPISGLICVPYNKRKTVWIDTWHGFYALNGSAISLANSAKKAGKSLFGVNDKPIKIGRFYIDMDKLSELIQEGLKNCP